MPTYLETVTEALREEDGGTMPYDTLTKFVHSRRATWSESWLRRALKKGVDDQVLEKTSAGYRLVLRKKLETDFFTQDEKEKLKARAQRLLLWSPDRTDRVFEAYGQFIALKAHFGDWDAVMLSPPPLVDELWHLAVLDTKVYNPWCHRVFGRVLHHDPDGDVDKADRTARRAKAHAGVNQFFPAYDRFIWDPPAPVAAPAPLPVPVPVQDGLNIRIRDQGGEETYIRMNRTTKFGKIFCMFATRKEVAYHSLRFIFDGFRIAPYQTPGDLDMDDDDEIQVWLEQKGC